MTQIHPCSHPTTSVLSEAEERGTGRWTEVFPLPARSFISSTEAGQLWNALKWMVVHTDWKVAVKGKQKLFPHHLSLKSKGKRKPRPFPSQAIALHRTAFSFLLFCFFSYIHSKKHIVLNSRTANNETFNTALKHQNSLGKLRQGSSWSKLKGLAP